MGRRLVSEEEHFGVVGCGLGCKTAVLKHLYEKANIIFSLCYTAEVVCTLLCTVCYSVHNGDVVRLWVGL